MDVDFRVLELLCGRLCHELISPVGAINNGVELLDEEDPDFVKEAMALIGQSARRAGQRLQFYRFAYGTAGESASSGGSAPDGRALSQALLEGGKVQCDWSPAMAGVPLPWQRLACNMVVLSAELLPRGGTLAVRPHAGGSGVDVVAEGETVNVSPELTALLASEMPVEGLTARTIHAFYTARLAQRLGAKLTLALSSDSHAVLSASASATR